MIGYLDFIQQVMGTEQKCLSGEMIYDEICVLESLFWYRWGRSFGAVVQFKDFCNCLRKKFGGYREDEWSICKQFFEIFEIRILKYFLVVYESRGLIFLEK